MRYVLRADASESIGAGHVMRSSAIAEELIARGENVVFLGQISGLPWVEERIASLGFTMIHDYPSEFISKPESDVLILDSYEISINDNNRSITMISKSYLLNITRDMENLLSNG